MADSTSLCNQALRMLGNFRITSFADGSEAGELCGESYDERRFDMLRSNEWSFATERVKLARLVEEPAFGWQYYYQLPSDFFRMIAVSNNDAGRGTVPYKIEGDRLATHAEDIWIRYVKDVTDVNLMPPDFRTAFAAKLAYLDLAIPLTQSRSLRADAKAEWQQAIAIAKATGAIEDFPEMMPESSWITTRQRGVRNTSDDWSLAYD